MEKYIINGLKRGLLDKYNIVLGIIGVMIFYVRNSGYNSTGGFNMGMVVGANLAAISLVTIIISRGYLRKVGVLCFFSNLLCVMFSRSLEVFFTVIGMSVMSPLSILLFIIIIKNLLKLEGEADEN